MALTSVDVSLAVRHIASQLEELEPTLNAADSRLGDGDTGTMLARMGRGLTEADLEASTDLGEVFMTLTKATLASTGSSLGTLIGTAFMTFAKATKGKSELEWTAVSGLLDDAVTAMSARGKSALGDKTILDSLNAIARATESAENRDEFVARARVGAQTALDDLRDQPCQIGRARMYREQSIGVDDPGMLAVALVLR
ncbi:MAG: dihydroxyacetone kinase subunit L [Thermomicrobiales bacterium]|nr:dihydroxyacetone kinase subunit L [Thermomicrobiales bacterium]MCO5223792.1 dihydroxyacetone kinase subunit L [Thermomicrobiales bacterium]MCO5228509.1 dihydroxyacetone kinase subunit L [Thermomicrobiales bacterium]